MKLKSGLSYLMCARMIPMTDSYHENAMITQEKNECFVEGCNDEQQNGKENKNVTNRDLGFSINILLRTRVIWNFPTFRCKLVIFWGKYWCTLIFQNSSK